MRRSTSTTWMPAGRKFRPKRHWPKRISDRSDIRLSREVVDRKLRGRTQTNRNEDRSNTSIDVQLTVALTEPARHIGSYQPAGSDPRADELQCDLSAVRMSRQAEIDSEFGGAVKRIRVMAE